MNIEYIRSSSINTFKDCQMKFFLEYILEIPSFSGKAALLGTICHHVLEILANAKKTNHHELNDKYVDPNYLLNICWQRYKREELSKKNGIVLDDKKDFVFCQKTIDKVLNSNLNPLLLDILETERQFVIPLKEEGFKFQYIDIISGTEKSGHYEIRGTIDLITKLDDETIEIIDWKTGSRRDDFTTGEEKDFEYLSSKDIQLRMYDYAVYKLFPQYKYRLLTINFINAGGPYTVTFTDEQRQETLEILKESFNKIRGVELPSRIKEEKPDHCWKCSNLCTYGKTGPNQNKYPFNKKKHPSWCDIFHSYNIANGTDNTIKYIDKIKKEKQKTKKNNLTSDRRNNYKEKTE